VSAVLALNVGDVHHRPSPVPIEMRGKGNHTYQIMLQKALPALRVYLSARFVLEDNPPASAPLFISHDTRYAGQRMSRIIAWRIIQRAAQGVGLGRGSPQDIRHWCAQQLIEQGASLEDVRQALGHRSIHTVRIYYGHMLNDQSS
jgi:site-specific recombinase XerD